MATPNYKGAPVPANSGWLSGLGSLFAGQAPAYAGQGQVTQSAGFFGSGAPAYKSAPTAAASATADTAGGCDEPERITVLIPRELIDPSSQTEQ